MERNLLQRGEHSAMSLKLSILVPSIPSRFEKFQRIFAKLQHQIQDRDVEILGLFDNKKRSIGLKRDALVQSSKGEYVAFVDDDDNISPDYIVKLLQAMLSKPDVITFKQTSIINGEQCVVDFDLRHKENEPFVPGSVVKRRPFHVCAFKGDIARKYHFPDKMYGEDWAWCEQVLKDVKTQVKIDEIIHVYIFDSEVTEAK